MPRKTSATTDTVTFNGIKFNRYPNSKNRSDRKYYRPAANYIRQGICYLHQEIWKAAYGPIPEGHHIHHIDRNPLNNHIDNLESKPSGSHLSEHQIERTHSVLPDGRTVGQAHLDSVRHLSAEWHRSAAGRAWHRRHARKIFSTEARPVRVKLCDNCGSKFETKDLLNREKSFCSNRCKSAFRRKSGLDDVERVCSVCKSSFTTNKYSKQFTCSRVCGARTHGDKIIESHGRL
jgi:hypothetical protein